MPITARVRRRLELDCLVIEAYLSTIENRRGKRLIAFLENPNGRPRFFEAFLPDNAPTNAQGQRTVRVTRRGPPMSQANDISEMIENANILDRRGLGEENVNRIMEQMYEYMANVPSY